MSRGGTLSESNSRAANDWADRKRRALEHAKALRAERAVQAEAKYASVPAAAPMDALDQHMSSNTLASPPGSPGPAPSPPAGDALGDFMADRLPGDTLGDLGAIGARGRASPAPVDRPHLEPPAREGQQVRRDSLALLKKRNPQATRRPRGPRVPIELVAALRCGVCGEMCSEAVDCNYCHAVFCREHFEEEASREGRCPGCKHRCSSYDCTHNVPLQKIIALATALLEPAAAPAAAPPVPAASAAAPVAAARRPVPEPQSGPSLTSCQPCEQDENGYVAELSRGPPRRKSRQAPVQLPPSPAAAQPRTPPTLPRPVARQPEPEPATEEQPGWEEPPAPTSQCRGCGRSFRIDVLAKHEPRCIQKAKGPKRNVFNARAQALADNPGAHMYQQEITGRKQQDKTEDRPFRPKVPKWKQQSEELKSAMRAEREYKQAKKQGKPLPPPPAAVQDSSYVPCPHCGRTFSETAKPSRLMRGSGQAGGKNVAAARRRVSSGRPSF